VLYPKGFPLICQAQAAVSFPSLIPVHIITMG
jgi:hypothetical protein